MTRKLVLLISIYSSFLIDLILDKSKGVQRWSKEARCLNWSAGWATKRKTWQLENFSINIRYHRNVWFYFYDLRLQNLYTLFCLQINICYITIIVIQCIVVELVNKWFWFNYLLVLVFCIWSKQIYVSIETIVKWRL